LGWAKMKIQLDKISSVTGLWLLDIRCRVGTNMAELTVPLLTISRNIQPGLQGSTAACHHHTLHSANGAC